ncbi:MAG: tetratricopeptide repeat protein [Saccharothrix sp.]|nr:tetratricopeptide repeat protein [Saccharothrix sp.]
MERMPVHHSILTFDVEGFADPHRDERAHAGVRAALYRIFRESLAAAGVPERECVIDDRGDGAIVLVPAGVPTVLLLHPLLDLLVAGLREHNRRAPLAQRFRLRVALHTGDVGFDGIGHTGQDLLLACRLVDAEPVKAALRTASTDLVVVVSDDVHARVVSRGFRGVDPSRFHPVALSVKATRTHGWVHLPGTDEPPDLGAGGQPEVTAPRQLPSPGVLVGREDLLAELDARHERGARLLVLVGPPGVGKRTVALHWAHRAGARFRDGQLHADLGAAGSTADEVLGRFLRALGEPPGRIPFSTSERAALYRSRTADKNLLVVLDDATSVEQVRLLVPSGHDSVVVVSGRARLGPLAADGAKFAEVRHLTQTESVVLLQRLVGKERIDAEPEQARRLAGLCGGLPIAVCVGGARLASRPRWTVEKAVTDLLDERRRLAHLSYQEELSVKTVFDVAYQSLSPQAARLYRLLGLHPGPDFHTRLAAASLGRTPDEGERLVDELMEASLLEERGDDRYAFHDLVRLHAREQAEAAESDATRRLALRRMLDWYLDTATRAQRVSAPHRGDLRREIEHVPVEPVSFATHSAALRWFERERVNLLESTRFAASNAWPQVAHQLADSMWGLFLYRNHYREQLEFDLLAVRAARDCGDRHAEAEAEDRLGLLLHSQGRNDEALPHLANAAARWQELGDRHRVAGSLERFGFAYLDQGDAARALEQFEQALARFRELGHHRSTGLALISTGRALLAGGRAAEALPRLTEAHDVLAALDVPDPYNTARAVLYRAKARTALGDHATARSELATALRAMRAIASPLGEADVLRALADVHLATGDTARALPLFTRHVELLEEVGNFGAARAREELRALPTG